MAGSCTWTSSSSGSPESCNVSVMNSGVVVTPVVAQSGTSSNVRGVLASSLPQSSPLAIIRALARSQSQPTGLLISSVNLKYKSGKN